MYSTLRVGAAGLAIALGCSTLAGARADSLFAIDVTAQNFGSGPTSQTLTGSRDFNTISSLVNAVSNASLSSIVNGYNSNSAAIGDLSIRGISAVASYRANSPVLTFTVPSLGINVSFNGQTRDQSQSQFKNFLLQNGGGILTQLLQGLVKTSPIDPVAGNPTSAQNFMARQDFAIATGFGGSTDTQPGSGQVLTKVPNLLSAGGEIGYASSGRFDSSIVTLPFRYTLAFDDPRYALTFDLPLTYVETNNAISAYGSLGASLRVPVVQNWYLVPNARIGVSGSEDLGAAAMQYSVGAGSQYNIYLDDLKIVIGNAIEYSKTDGLSIGTVNVNYNLNNELFTNGVQLEGSLPFTVFDSPTSWQAYIADTYVAGSAVYIDHYDEIGGTIGTRHPPNSQDWDSLRLGLAVTAAENYTAVKANFLYRF